jgi:DNA-binding NtrC family response regulator
MAAARVLIVDDDEFVLGFTSRILMNEGYEVLPTTSPRQALEIVKDSSIDLIVCDVEMPELPGTELVREVARISPRTARVLMTGMRLHSAAAPEGVQVLHKPFFTADLISTIQAVLEQSDRLCDDLSQVHQRSVERMQRREQLISKSEALVQKAVEIINESCRLREHIEKQIDK